MMVVFSLLAACDKAGDDAWDYEIEGTRAASIDQTTLFAVTSDHVVALNVASGEELWKKSLPGGLREAPGFQEDLVFVGTDEGILWVLDSDDGTPLAKAILDGPIGSKPVFEHQTLLVSTFGGSVYAFDPQDRDALKKAIDALPEATTPEEAPDAREPDAGEDPKEDGPKEEQEVESKEEDIPLNLDVPELEPRWRARTSGPIVAPITSHLDDILIASTDGRAYALSMADGTRSWTWEGSRQLRNSVVFADGFFFVASDDGNLHALTPKGTVQWSAPTLGAINSSPLVWNGLVIVSNSIGRVTAFDSKSGIEKWQFQVPAGIRHEPVLVADRLALVDLNGQLHLLKPAEGKLDTSRALADFGPLISTEDGLVILGRTSVFKRTLSAWNEP